MKALMSLTEAADQASQSTTTLRRAIHTTGVDTDGRPTFPPPLKAKRGAKGKYLIRAEDLQAWIDSLPDA